MSSWPRDLARRRTWRAGPPMFMRVVKTRTDGAPPVATDVGGAACVAPLAPLIGPTGNEDIVEIEYFTHRVPGSNPGQADARG